MNESMSKCILDFMLVHLRDSSIRPVVQQYFDVACQHLDTLYTLFQNENFSIPNGFSDQDVNLDAPWLFSDIFCLSYLNHMAKVGMLTYSGFIAMSTREDIRKRSEERRVGKEG